MLQDTASKTSDSRRQSLRNNRDFSGKKIHTTSILTNANNVNKKESRAFTEKLKETLRVFQKIKNQNEKEDDIVRNYGPGWEIKQLNELE